MSILIRSVHKRRPDIVSKALTSSQGALHSHVTEYEKGLSHLQKVTSSDSLAGLVEHFKGIDENNFSLFNFVNQINYDMETTTADLQRLQLQIRLSVQENLEENERHENVRWVAFHFLQSVRCGLIAN